MNCNCPNIGACDGSCAPYNEPTPMAAQTAPERIYLVIGEDCPQDITFRELCSRFDDGVTWCEDQINANDIRYVRADVHDALADELERLRAQVARIAEHYELPDAWAAPAQQAEPPCPYYIAGPDITKGAYAVAEVATGRIVARIPAEQAPSLTVGARTATFGALMAVTAEKNKLHKALELACGYLTEEQVAEIAAAMPSQPSDPEPDLCQMCGDKAYPGCNSEFSAEPACRFWGPGNPSAQGVATDELLDIARDELDEIALAGMSGSGQESEEGMREWHARQAWKFIGIAARAIDKIKVRAAIAQAPAAEPQWQPIETAPKNGRKLILAYRNRADKARTVMARWLTDEEAAETDADGVGLEGGWYECIDNWGEYTEVTINEGEPTHWMLPPSPPAADSSHQA